MKDENDDLKNGLEQLPALVEMMGSTPFAETIMRHTKKVVWSMVQFKELRMMYECAIKEVRTKLEVLDTEYGVRYKRNPIKTITSRIKSTESIIEKLLRYKFPVTLESVEQNLNDVAGIRVVCSYIDDIYRIADAILAQDDITLVRRKDYIQNPKENGYRSLHLIVKVPVFFAETKKDMKVEVQIRTIAMDFWASLEHQISYKHDESRRAQYYDELKACADVITQTDRKMLELRKRIEESEGAPDEEEMLLEKLRQLDL